MAQRFPMIAGRSLSARPRALVLSFAGPALIVGVVLVATRKLTFEGRLEAAAGDIATFFLPYYCFLGKAISSGELPAWNPYTLSGAPFAADVLSGWMYLPVMALFSALPCALALRALMTLYPIVAGLGTYWFLRTEGFGRPAAVSAGLSLSMTVAASALLLSLPFSGTLVWTPLVLAAASRSLSARTWPGRILWTLGASLAWGALLAAHMSAVLAIGTGAVLLYVVLRLAGEVRSSVRSVRDAMLHGALLAAALPLVNLAFLLPRLAYLPRITLGRGYGRLVDLVEASHLSWPLKLATSPGTYLGAAILLLCLAAWPTRRHRPLYVTLILVALIGYALSLEAVSERLAPVISSWPLADLYLHNPARLRLAVLLTLPMLAALGLEGWLRARSPRRRVLMLLPGVLVWGLLPFLLGAGLERRELLAAGALGAVAVLAFASRRPALISLMPVLLAVELTAHGLLGSAVPRDRFVPAAIRGPWTSPPMWPARGSGRKIEELLKRDSIVRALDRRPRGRYLVRASGRGWHFNVHSRSMVWGLEHVHGYNPSQLPRYFDFAQALGRRNRKYNVTLVPIHERALDLLQVRWVVSNVRPNAPVRLVRPLQGGLKLYELESVAPRAAVVGEWEVVADARAALQAVISPRFDASERVILEQAPGIHPPDDAVTGTASYEQTGANAARVAVTTEGRALVLIRNPYERYWQARLDGRPVPVLRADYLLQAVAVPTAGRHVIHLAYRDPWIGYGLAGSGLSAAVLLALAALSARARTAGDSQGRRFSGGERARRVTAALWRGRSRSRG